MPNGLYYAYTGTEIVIPAMVQEIGRSAFYNTKNVRKITYNATNCTTSTSSPFYYLRNTTEDFIIGEGVKNIPDYLLCDFINVTTINLPASLTTIGKHAFENCGITSIDLNNVTTIDAYGFYNSALTSVTIPEGVTTIGSRAFYNCKSLTSVTFNATNCADITSENYTWFKNSPVKNFTFGPKVTHIPAYIAYENTEFDAFDIPSQVTTIGEYAFYNSALASITIPKNITTIGAHAFSYCKSLAVVHYNAEYCESPTTLSGSAFYNSAITNFVIGDDVHHLPSYLLYRVKSLKTLTIPEGVTSIGKNPFGYCENLREVNFNAVKCVADPAITNSNYAWFGDTHLYTLNIGEKVELIPEYLAYNQDSITEYNIPESVKEIGRYAFYSCAQLKIMQLPRNIEKIDDYAFYKNEVMKGDVYIPATLKYMGKYIISDCDNVGNIIVEAPVASPIHKNAFGDDIHRKHWLIVPCGSAQSYKEAEGWTRFNKMINDINGDNVIDVADMNAVINCILFESSENERKACDE
ncbi:MAG: leucine-rich repeat domain-containing protein, partial [Bacteroidales bacterium]|nr:leucine-rich repeat domain-containing protein [Candidatus Sodaliphilus fimicaballi]